MGVVGIIVQSNWMSIDSLLDVTVTSKTSLINNNCCHPTPYVKIIVS